MVDNKSKTVAELAENIGVSKSAILHRLDEGFKTVHVVHEGNRYLIDRKGQRLIKTWFKPEEKNNRVKYKNDPLVHELYTRIHDLKSEVKTLRKELNRIYYVNSKLEVLLDRQQKLELADKDKKDKT